MPLWNLFFLTRSTEMADRDEDKDDVNVYSVMEKVELQETKSFLVSRNMQALNNPLLKDCANIRFLCNSIYQNSREDNLGQKGFCFF